MAARLRGVGRPLLGDGTPKPRSPATFGRESSSARPGARDGTLAGLTVEPRGATMGRAHGFACRVNVADLITALTRPDDALASTIEPLPATWADPEGYRHALAEHVARWGLGRVRSQPGKAVDPYADAVGRYARATRPALIWHDADRGWLSMTYARLDQLASAVAARWMAQGARPGATIALIHDPGPQRLVDLMAALRIGAVVSLLEPYGTTRLPARLAALAPDFLAFDQRREPPLGDCEARRLDGSGGDQAGRAVRTRSARALPPPHPYAAGAPLARLFSPVRAPGTHPTTLRADDAVFGALSDGVVGWRLSPGRSLAAPGAHPLQYSPGLELSVLLCGATLVHIDWPALERTPRLLAEQSVDVLFISEALRDLLTRRPVTGLTASHWVRGLDAPLDWTTWRDLIRSLNLDKVPASNMLIDAAGGGSLFNSVQRPGSASARCVPAAGRRWSMLDVTAPDRAAVGDVGLFQRTIVKSPEPDAPPAAGPPKAVPDPAERAWCLLGHQRPEYLFGGPRTLRRMARVYPVAEVEAVVQRLPGVVAPCVVGIPAGGDGWFAVLVFSGAPGPKPPPTVDAVRAALRAAIGPDARPDAVEVLPMYPRRIEGKVDRAWCTLQYQSGRLAARLEHDAFSALTALRAELIGE